MSYLALYRQFRPKTFDEIIGQEHVVQTLINQINMGRVGHAYLFCGARGTGKTTAAKVFARAINCTSPKNGSPCGECEVCKKLESPSNLDILEMDAASNNKVENVRDIRDKIQYPPVAGKYKVYIIDEVHMLTTEAFNALLKTLEEPPSHAVFILATTEVHKIPATILSRCLRFDFKLISTAKIAEFICEIYDKVGKKYQKEAVTLIAKAGEGSVRDALSIADICLSYSKGELTYDDVLEVLGTSDRAVIEELIGAMFAGETGKMLSLTDELLMRGKSVSILNRDVASALRDILVIKTCSNASEVLAIPQDKLKELEKLSAKTDVHALLRSIEIFSVAEADLKFSTHPKIVFETAAVKASLPQADYNIDALMARIATLEKKLEKGEFTAKTTVVERVEKVEKEPTSPAVEIKPAVQNIQEKAQEKVVTERVEEEKKAEVKPEIKQEVKAKKPIEDEMDADLASLLATAEQSGYGDEEGQFSFGDYEPVKPKKSVNKPVNAVKAQEKVAEEVTKPQEKAVETKKEQVKEDSGSQAVSVDKAWGAILRKLRQDKEIMLWVACQDVAVKSSGSVVLIDAPGENEFALLSKNDNLIKLTKYVSEYGYTEVRILKDDGDKELLKEENAEVEKVQEFFDGERLKIEN